MIQPAIMPVLSVDTLDQSERSESELSSSSSDDDSAESDASDGEEDAAASSSSSSDSDSSSFSSSEEGDSDQDAAWLPVKPPPSSRHDNDSDLDTISMLLDNLGGVVALLIPITGISTMVATEALACSHHFDCARDYPTLSYAATFKPEMHAFTPGMCLTAFFIATTVSLFVWFVRLKTTGPSAVAKDDIVARFLAGACLLGGLACAISLAGLAIMDMRNYHDAHIAFTVVFFVTAWVMMVSVHLARRKLLFDENQRSRGNFLTMNCSPFDSMSLWLAMQQWKRGSLAAPYVVGRFFLFLGIASTVLCAFLLRYSPLPGCYLN